MSSTVPEFLVGGAEGDRTPDLCIANAALSQLSYGPKKSKRQIRMQAAAKNTLFHRACAERDTICANSTCARRRFAASSRSAMGPPARVSRMHQCDGKPRVRTRFDSNPCVRWGRLARRLRPSRRGAGVRSIQPAAPVLGGLVVSIVVLIARSQGVTLFQFDTTLQSPLMIAFFTTIGFGASLRIRSITHLLVNRAAYRVTARRSGSSY